MFRTDSLTAVPFLVAPIIRKVAIFSLLLSSSFFTATPIHSRGKCAAPPGHPLHPPASRPGPSPSFVIPSLSSSLPYRRPLPPSAAPIMLYGTMAPGKGRSKMSTPQRAFGFGFLGGGYQISGDPLGGITGPPRQHAWGSRGQRIISVCFFRCHGTHFGGSYTATTTQQI